MIAEPKAHNSETLDLKRMTKSREPRKRISIRALLKPHSAALTFAFIAVIGEGLADLLGPWPLKLVLDYVVGSRAMHGWLGHLVESLAGTDKLAILKVACGGVLLIALIDAVSSYTEKYFTTSVGQWITHDLRRTLYSHIQRMSLAYHDEKRTGDLISRVTSDIDAIQSFITSGLLGGLINIITLVGMVGVMFYLNWQFTLIALVRGSHSVSWSSSPTRGGSRRHRAKCERRKAKSFP